MNNNIDVTVIIEPARSIIRAHTTQKYTFEKTIEDGTDMNRKIIKMIEECISELDHTPSGAIGITLKSKDFRFNQDFMVTVSDGKLQPWY